MHISNSFDRPIFIIGSPRSGTTLLRLMLTAHPDICIPPESMFFVRLEKKYGNGLNSQKKVEDFLNDIYQEQKFQEWNLDRGELREKLPTKESLKYAEAVAMIYEQYRQKNNYKACIWGDKNPNYYLHTDTIIKYFPKAKIIHIVRDIRAVYNSLLRVRESHQLWQEKNAKFSVLTMTKIWSKIVKLIEKSQNNERFYLIYYEKLISDPRGQIKTLCSWLGLDFSESMLEFYETNARKNLVPSHRLAWHQNTLKPVSTKRVDAWMNELTTTEIEALELMNWKTMKKLGYHCITDPWRYRGLLKLLSEIMEDIRKKVNLFIK